MRETRFPPCVSGVIHEGATITMSSTDQPSDLAPVVAYLSDGKLYLKEPAHPARLIDSTFAQGIVDRVTRSNQRNGWKRKGMGWGFNMRGPQMDEVPAETRRIRVSGVTGGGSSGDARELVYALDTDHVGGLFAFDPATNSERRLLHRNGFRAHDLTRHRADGTLAFALQSEDGTSNIAILAPEGRGPREVTEGDSVDEGPSWSAAGGRVLVFQSAGVGRNAHGMRVALGPYAIQRLDLDSGDLTTLLEDDATDYLVPRLAADGALWYVRRPYQSSAPMASPLKVALDVLLFPYRLIRAIIHFLNFFSIMFARKPLITAGGPPKEGPDTRYLMLWGKVIDAEKALRDSSKSGGRGLVPKSWELVRRVEGGDEQVVARGVICYDLCPDGTAICTDGSNVLHVDAAGKSASVCQGHVIERVSVVG